MFTFNGTHADTYGLRVVTVDRSPLPSLDTTLLTVPNRNGAYFVRNRIGVREIPVEVNLTGSSEADLRSKARDIGGWLYADKPKPLIFDDEPDKQYTAIIDKASLEETLRVGEGELLFICPSPYATEITPTTYAGLDVSANGTKKLTVAGNAMPYPKFTFNFTGSTSEVFYTCTVEGVSYEMTITGAFDNGDVLEVDHERGSVLLNGTNAMPMLSLDSEFFALELGSEYVWFAGIPATLDVEYKCRWL